MTTFSGPLISVSEGRAINALNPTAVRVPMIRIGDKVIRSSVMSDELFALLQSSRDCTLTFGWFFHRRWLVSVNTDGKLFRTGVVGFLLTNVLHSIGAGTLLYVMVGTLWQTAPASFFTSIGAIVGFGLNLERWLHRPKSS